MFYRRTVAVSSLNNGFFSFVFKNKPEIFILLFKFTSGVICEENVLK
jgi:hypothetical protein